MSRARTAPTLRRTWLALSLSVATVLAVFGGVAVGATAYQRSAVSAATAEVERTVTALLDLRLAVLTVDDAAAGLMYGLGGPSATAGHAASFERGSAEIDARFGELQRVVPASSMPAVQKAHQQWETTESGIRRAPAMVADGSVAAALEKGVDPFAQVWRDYGAISEELAEVERRNVEAMRQRIQAVDQLQRHVPAALVVVLAVAMVAIFLGARRMLVRIVSPLHELRRAALSMRDGQTCEGLDLRRASAELQSLALTIQDTAVTLRSSHLELREQALTDALTGLPNRTAFLEELDLRFGRAEQVLGVLFVDLDDFKVVNDSFGHAAGDALLRVVASRLRAAVRGTDLVARLGGDEFAVLVDCTADPVAASAAAGSILAALNEPVHIAGQLLGVDCSVGVATTQTGAESAQELVRNADFAMYTAKGRGKNCVETFAPTVHLTMQLQSEYKNDLAQAVAQGQLVLHYQPIVDLVEQRVLGMEALVRWDHPSRGLVPPAEFIRLTEETGDIVSLGAWVLERACADLATHQRDVDAPLWVSVNVSPVQLADAGFVGIVLGALTRNGLSPQSLVLEITETAAIANTAVANSVLSSLRACGVRVALDDFGVGHSSLSHLRELPVDILKIDRSFVVDEGRKGISTLTAIVSMAQDLGLSVIAEGVEQAEQAERLRGLGEVTAQGFLFACPLPAQAVDWQAQRVGTSLPLPRPSSGP